MQKEPKKLNGQATPEEIAKWKTANPSGIYFIASETDIAYFREPTRHDVNKAMSEADEEFPLAGIEKFGALTFIGGSEAILKDDSSS